MAWRASAACVARSHDIAALYGVGVPTSHRSLSGLRCLDDPEFKP